jgi:hypothetical protein
MDHAEYDDLIGGRVEVDRVRKPSYERAACFALDARVRQRGLDDTGQHPIDFRRKGLAKPTALFLIPVASIQ